MPDTLIKAKARVYDKILAHLQVNAAEDPRRRERLRAAIAIKHISKCLEGELSEET